MVLKRPQDEVNEENPRECLCTIPNVMPSNPKFDKTNIFPGVTSTESTSSEPATEASTTVGSDEATTTALASSFGEDEEEDGEAEDETEVEATSLPRFAYSFVDNFVL